MPLEKGQKLGQWLSVGLEVNIAFAIFIKKLPATRGEPQLRGVSFRKRRQPCCLAS